MSLIKEQLMCLVQYKEISWSFMGAANNVGGLSSDDLYKLDVRNGKKKN